MENENLITTAEVVRLSGCARTTVQWWTATGKLHAIRVGLNRGAFGGRERLFRRSDVLAFLSQRAAKRQAGRRRKNNPRKKGEN